MKAVKSTKRKAVESDNDSEVAAPQSKKAKPTSKAASKTDNEPFWDLSTGKTPKRAAITSFKNMTLINIREYYEKDGDFHPGKKGISLSIDQYTALLKAIPKLNKALTKRGFDVTVDEDEDDKDDEEDGGVVREKRTNVAKKPRAREKPKKANIEATSDEDEEEEEADDADDE